MKVLNLFAAAAALCFAALACAQTQSAPQSGQSSQPSGAPAAQGGSASGGSAAAGGASAARGAVPVQQNQTRKQKFDQLDANSNGMISREEAATSPELVVIFVEADKNSDGSISAVEFQVVPLVQPDGTAGK
jgi:Ca2+-binding EF-hand superfamily protein